MKSKLKDLIKDLPMCYGTFKDYRENNGITYKDYLYLIENILIMSAHGYYYATTKGRGQL